MLNYRRITSALGVLAVGVFGACTSPTTTSSGPALVIFAAPRRIANDGTASTITVEASTDAGTAGSGTVSLTVNVGKFEDAGTSTTVTLDGTGQGTTHYSCKACGPGTETISGSWDSLSATASITVTSGSGGPQDSGSPGQDSGTIIPSGDAGLPSAMSWQSTTCGILACNVMGIQGSGVDEVSQVAFLIQDPDGIPVPGASVSFNLVNPPLNTVLIGDGGTVLSLANGLVYASIHSGPTIGAFQVTATVTSPTTNSAPVSAESPAIGVRGAKPSNQGMTFNCSPVNNAAYITPNTPPAGFQVTCNLAVTDRFNNPIGTGTSVSFLTEAGRIAGPVTLKAYDSKGDNSNEGTATVTFNTWGGNPLPLDVPPLDGGTLATMEPWYVDSNGYTRNPRDGLVTVVAYIPGEEFFYDDVQSGVYRSSETFIDQGEPFVDSNDNNTWDPGEYYFDTNHNGKWDGPSGIYNPNVTVWQEAHILYTGAAVASLSSIVPPPGFVPGTCLPDGGGTPGVAAGTFDFFSQYFPDFQLNRVQAAGTTISANLLQTGGAVSVFGGGSLLDSLGFDLQRTVINEQDGGECFDGDPACVWATSISNFGAGRVPSLEVTGQAITATACALNQIQSSVTVEDNETVLITTPFALPP